MPWISWNISAVDEFAPFASPNPHRPPIVLETVALNCLSYMYVQRERGGDDAFIAALWSDCSLLTSVRSASVLSIWVWTEQKLRREGGREGGRIEEELFEGEKRAWAGKLAQKCRF